ncbi:MAG: hypothetical protein LC713_08040, partial [Actinobacteria bacterium]|nr:hypothetical protein [Actinomycetota bacterium]
TQLEAHRRSRRRQDQHRRLRLGLAVSLVQAGLGVARPLTADRPSGRPTAPWWATGTRPVDVAPGGRTGRRR